MQANVVMQHANGVVIDVAIAAVPPVPRTVRTARAQSVQVGGVLLRERRHGALVPRRDKAAGGGGCAVDKGTQRWGVLGEVFRVAPHEVYVDVPQSALYKLQHTGATGAEELLGAEFGRIGLCTHGGKTRWLGWQCQTAYVSVDWGVHPVQLWQVKIRGTFGER